MILLWTMPVAIRRRRYLKASKRGQRASMQLKLKLNNLLIISKYDTSFNLLYHRPTLEITLVSGA